MPRLSEAIEKAGGAAVVARNSGISASSISGYLNEGIEPKFVKMALLAKACEVSLDWLAYGKDDIESHLNAATASADPTALIASKSFSEHANKAANFRALVMLLLAAQETSRQTGKASTVADVLEYIERLYQIFSAMKDGPIRLKPFDDSGDENG